MEKAFTHLLTVEEKILEQMKKEERSTYWLARKIGKSQSFVYRILIGKGERKLELSQDVLDKIHEAFPGCKFDSLPHEQLEQTKQSLKEKPLFKDEKEN